VSEAPAGIGFAGSRAGARYDAGCAIVADVQPQKNGRDLVEVWQQTP
jgi:hypothetical protein